MWSSFANYNFRANGCFPETVSGLQRTQKRTNYCSAIRLIFVMIECNSPPSRSRGNSHRISPFRSFSSFHAFFASFCSCFDDCLFVDFSDFCAVFVWTILLSYRRRKNRQKMSYQNRIWNEKMRRSPKCNFEQLYDLTKTDTIFIYLHVWAAHSRSFFSARESEPEETVWCWAGGPIIHLCAPEKRAVSAEEGLTVIYCFTAYYIIFKI